MRPSASATPSLDGTAKRKSFKRRTISLVGGGDAGGESQRSPSRSRTVSLGPGCNVGGEMQRSPSRKASKSAMTAAPRTARDLELVRETYRAAREVYIQLKDRRFEAKGGKCRRFFLASQSVFAATRFAMQKKRYYLQIAKHAVTELHFFKTLREALETNGSSLTDAPDAASGKSQFFQALQDTGSDSVSGELVKSGGVKSCIHAIHEMLRSSTDVHEIGERLSTLVEEITNASGVSYEKAYKLSQSLRSSFDDLLRLRSRMDDLSVQSAVRCMQDLLGPPPPLQLTDRMLSKEAPKPESTSQVHWRGALAEQDTSTANEQQACMAGKGASSLAQNRLILQEPQLATMERCSILEHAHTDEHAPAWLHCAQDELEATMADAQIELEATGCSILEHAHAGEHAPAWLHYAQEELDATMAHAQIELEATMAVKSTEENQTSMDQVTQPPSISADTCSGDLPQSRPRRVLLPLSSTTHHSHGRQDDGTYSKQVSAESTKTSADDANLRVSRGRSCLRVAAQNIFNVDGSYLLDDEAFDDLAESVPSPSKVAWLPRSLRPRTDAHGGRSAAEDSQDPWDEFGSPSVSRSVAPPTIPQKQMSIITMDIGLSVLKGSLEDFELPQLAARTKGMLAWETPAISRNSLRSTTIGRTKTDDVEADDIEEGTRRGMRRRMGSKESTEKAAVAATTAPEMAAAEAETARWAMSGRMRSKESTKNVAVAATTTPAISAAGAEVAWGAMRGRMGSKESNKKLAVATTTTPNLASVKAETARRATRSRMGNKESTKKVAVAATTAPEMAAAETEAAPWPMRGRMGSKESTKKVSVAATTAPRMAAPEAEAVRWAMKGRMGSKGSTDEVAVAASAAGAQVQGAREHVAPNAGPPDAFLPPPNVAVAASNQPMLLPPLQQPLCLPEDLHTASSTPKRKGGVHQPTPPTSPNNSPPRPSSRAPRTSTSRNDPGLEIMLSKQPGTGLHI